MRRLIPILVVMGVLMAFAATLAFLWDRSRDAPEVFVTEHPALGDIVRKTVATGSIVPRNEVELKPRVSGIVERIHVEAGETLAVGALVADIRIVPDSLRLQSARDAVRAAELGVEQAQNLVSRSESLYAKGALSEADIERDRLNLRRSQQELAATRSNLQLVREGTVSKGNAGATQVTATIGGMVLDVPVREGESVIESNTFNAGTTIASVADMNDLIFEGRVDESEVGRVAVGMPLELTLGALPDARFQGTLEYIAPKGQLDQGAVQFPIRAAIEVPEGIFVRAGSSANADIVLDRREGVLAIREALLQFEGEAPYVEVEVGDQNFERREITLGLSDGVQVEVMEGLSAEDKVKRPGGAGG